ncbi:MAG: hypothetical protein JJE47_16345 [Acidimicrobiia bacterium]|nr:hypothetical protein [Acidimicrobiia bacterium]
MKQTFGLSWENGKQKLIAAIVLLLIAVTMALAPAASNIEAAKKTLNQAEVGVTVKIQTSSYSLRGSTWG